MPLILIPTPIGNMGDITLRALEELKSADLIACEDTRHSGLLLSRYGVKRPLMSYQKFNEQARVDELLARLAKGEKIAVISDAGTPGMSDPGYVILKAAVEAGLPVDVLPGATAFVPAVLLSGLEPHPFSFVGFLSDQKGERVAALEKLKGHPYTMVFTSRRTRPRSSSKTSSPCSATAAPRSCARSAKSIRKRAAARCPRFSLRWPRA